MGYYSSLLIVKLTLILFSYACFQPVVQGLNHRGKGTKFSVIKQAYRSLEDEVDEVNVEPEEKESKSKKDPKEEVVEEVDLNPQGYSVDITEFTDGEISETVASSMTSPNSASFHSSRSIVVISVFVSMVAFHCFF